MKTSCCNTRHIYKFNKHNICINSACENYLGFTQQKTFIEYCKKPVLIIIITFALLFYYDDFSMEKTGNYIPPTLLPIKQGIITIQQVEAELKEQKIMCDREVLAQIKIESGFLSSVIFKRTNNMLGMRYPFNRNTKASGIYIPVLDTVIYGSKVQIKKFRKTAGYAVYNTWQDGLADYKLWQEEYFKLSERYLEFIGNNYAEDPVYVQKIRNMINN